MHRNGDGVEFEQSGICVLPGTPAPVRLGEAFANAFAAFSIVRHRPPVTNRSDGPGFKASGCASIRQFESQYIPIFCSALAASNAVVRASVPHPANPECEIAWHFNPLLAPAAIGEGLLRLAALARAP
jgi:hypothetical protein